MDHTPWPPHRAAHRGGVFKPLRYLFLHLELQGQKKVQPTFTKEKGRAAAAGGVK